MLTCPRLSTGKDLDSPLLGSLDTVTVVEGTNKVKLEGLAARVFQHEYDHMEGIDFSQRANVAINTSDELSLK